MTPFNNRVNSNSNFDFMNEMKANAFPGNSPSGGNPQASLEMVREAINGVGMTGVLELKRMLVGKSGRKEPDYSAPRNRSRSYGSRKKGEHFDC